MLFEILTTPRMRIEVGGVSAFPTIGKWVLFNFRVCKIEHLLHQNLERGNIVLTGQVRYVPLVDFSYMYPRHRNPHSVQSKPLSTNYMD